MVTVVEMDGIYKKTISRDLKSGFTIFVLVCSQENQELSTTCTGYILPVPQGAHIHVRGQWKTDRVYGRQLTNIFVSRQLLDEQDLVRYIASGNLGIGTATAFKVVERFGMKLADCDADWKTLVSGLQLIRGMNRQNAEKMLYYLRRRQVQTKLYEYLIRLGGTYKDFQALYKLYGNDSLEELKHRPYEVGKKLYLDLKICDAVAKEQGGTAGSSERVESGIRWALRKAASEGHMYCQKFELLRKTQGILCNTVFPERVPIPIIMRGMDLATQKDVVKEGKLFYLQYLRAAEIEVAEAISRLNAVNQPYPEYKENLVKRAEAKNNVTYSKEQREAFSLEHCPGVKVIIGPPGTGKTTLVLGLISAFLMMYPNADIKLCAPTGRAAQRLAETTGLDAYTIHRLMEFRKRNDAGLDYKNQDEPLSADLLVVDEASMVNIEMARMLFSAVKTGALVLLVGDTSQLPAIGAGNLLHDLIFCDLIPKVILDAVYRQKESSYILKNARAINSGVSKMEQGNDFKILSVEDEDILDTVSREFVKQYDSGNPYAVQVLVSTNKIVEQLNETLQQAVNPHPRSIRYGGRTFKVGDKILMENNNYELGYFNGDIGVILAITADYVKVKIGQSEILLVPDELEDMNLGYAITTHKAQGSEFASVFVVLPQKPQKMLRRKLIYTAVTRGKQQVLVIGKEDSIAMAVANNEEGRRNSRLIERLTALARRRQKLERKEKKAA